MSLRRTALTAIGLALLVAAVFLCWQLWREAYGDGPPHYGQTTNMDKWSSPWPAIAIVTLVGAGSGGLMLWLGRR